jgi:hypothetical protein
MAAKNKKMAAALAAVNLYLQEEEAAAYEAETPLRATNPSEVSPWGHSGRQDMMSMRRLVQMRVFTRF